MSRFSLERRMSWEEYNRQKKRDKILVWSYSIFFLLISFGVPVLDYILQKG